MAALDTREIREAWNGIAAGYDRYVTPTHGHIASEGLERAGVKPGMTFLDVACGSGALSIPAAQRGAKVTATDLSPAMVELTQANAKREGVALDARVMDGQNLEFEDDRFDVSGSQWGVMLFPDLPRGVREMARVTRPGGKALLHCYGAPSQVEFISFFIEGVRAAVPGFEGLPSDPPPLPFQVADPAVLRQRCVEAGLKNVSIEATTETLEFQTGEDLWNWLIWSNPIPRQILRGLEVTPRQEAVIRGRLEEMVRERRGSGATAKLTNPVNIAIGAV